MKKKYFGTDGIRGHVGKSQITVDFMLKLGWAVGCVLAKEKNPTVVIGRDTRGSGVVLQSALQAGLSAAGVHTYLLGVVPTPAVAYLTHSLRLHAGVVISASHNPYYDNGVKFFNQMGMKLSDQMEYDIEAMLEQPLHMAAADALGQVDSLPDAAGRYIEFCKSTFPYQLDLQGVKCVLDCAQGANYDIAPKVFHELGADVIPIFNEPNGVNINDACGATHLKGLQQYVVDSAADVGIAFDGDGDRLMMVDHCGEVVDGDQLLGILAKDLARDGKAHQGVVGTLMSNLGLEQAMHASGLKFARAKVGDRYVLEELQQRGWRLGGESSGHIVNLDYTTTGDGIITALQVLRVMRRSGRSLYDLKQDIIKRPQVMLNVPVYGSVIIDHHPKLIAAIKTVENTLGSSARVLVRPSGTEPCVRVMIEGEDEALIQQHAQSLADVIAVELA